MYYRLLVDLILKLKYIFRAVKERGTSQMQYYFLLKKTPAKTKEKQYPLLNEIIPRLFLGSWKAAIKRGSLKKRNITHILNVTSYK